MPDKKKSKNAVNASLQGENVLEAVVVTDSFDDRLSPVTDHQSKVHENIYELML